jgi:hypothetical protein
MMLGEECESASYWKRCGDEALEKGIKGVVIMVCQGRLSAYHTVVKAKSDCLRELTGTL